MYCWRLGAWLQGSGFDSRSGKPPTIKVCSSPLTSFWKQRNNSLIQSVCFFPCRRYSNILWLKYYRLDKKIIVPSFTVGGKNKKVRNLTFFSCRGQSQHVGEILDHRIYCACPKQENKTNIFKMCLPVLKSKFPVTSNWRGSSPVNRERFLSINVNDDCNHIVWHVWNMFMSLLEIWLNKYLQICMTF